MSDTKKLQDNLSIITNMLIGCKDRLKDRYYVEIWPELEKQRIKLQQDSDRIKKILQAEK
jgi:hypothetical protein